MPQLQLSYYTANTKNNSMKGNFHPELNSKHREWLIFIDPVSLRGNLYLEIT